LRRACSLHEAELNYLRKRRACSLHEAELNYLRKHEWATRADDVLWHRSNSAGTLRGRNPTKPCGASINGL
jgi:glycerol-3-phosphate dehydrogenase